MAVAVTVAGVAGPYMSYRHMGYGYPAAPVVEEAPVQQVCCPPKKTSATAKAKASAY